MWKKYRYPLLIILLGVFFFMPHLGRVHLFDWDEINFAESAREMLATGNFSIVQIDYKPFWEKPPLFFWLQALSMKVFGINEFAARFPNAIAGIVIMLVLFYTGKRFFDEKFGLYFALSYFGGWLPFIYSQSGIIDPWFNLFMFLSVYFLLLRYTEQDRHSLRNLVLSAVFASLATLTKGPVGVLIPALTYFFALLFYEGMRKMITVREIAVYLLTLLVVGGGWFWMLILEGKSDIIVDFIRYQIRLFATQDAGHGGPFFYHFLVLLVGYFPLSFFAVYGMRKKMREDGLGEQQQRFSQWMFVLFWVVLILFSIVKTKIIHYSSMTYFPIAFFSALFFYRITDSGFRTVKWPKILTFVLAIVWTLAIVSLPWVEKHKDYLLQRGFLSDKFAAESLRTMYAGFDNFIAVNAFLLFLLIAGGLLMIKDKQKLFYTLVFASAFLLKNVMKEVVPKVEVYSQRAAIDFYRELQGKKVYVYPLGFKSYAHLFYTKKPPGMPDVSVSELLRCQAPYPAYFVAKVNNADEFARRYPVLKKMYAKGGFVFFEVTCNNKNQ